MFQNNPLLAQLKQQIEANKEYVEGTVKASDKAFGFLECDKKSYFIPPMEMKKVMHGDKVKAVVKREGDKEQVEIDSLLEPMLDRFIAQVRFNKDNKLQLIVDHPSIKNIIPANTHKKVTETLESGDWVVAQLKTHPLRDDRFLFAQITQFICKADDNFAPWWVTLARHEQPREPVANEKSYELHDELDREDLTSLYFTTIDSPSTQDMDDALYIEPIKQGEVQTGWRLVVAIADPTAYIPENSNLEKAARQRCFTNYLPGFNIPMLPRELSDDLCSLVPNEKRPALVGYIETDLAGNITGDTRFVSAWVESKAKLAYDNVSDYLEQVENAWQPESAETKQQIDWLHQFTLARIEWRRNNALLFKESGDYSFELNEDGSVRDIHVEYRRIANQMIEESMIIANICCAKFLADNAKTGVFNTHAGFDPKNLELAQKFLLDTLSTDENRDALTAFYAPEKLATLEGYCEMRRSIDEFPEKFLELRLRRYLTFAEFKSEVAPHLGLGISHYATWTSPIRKYGDMVNHRLIKQVLLGKQAKTVEEGILVRLQEARRQNRLVERDIADWLYARYLFPMVEQAVEFDCEIADVSRGGVRAKVIANGAQIFVPFSTLHDKKEEMEFRPEEIALYIKGEKAYQIGQAVKVKLTEVRLETRSIVGNII
ncbi:exoribonuclease II [Actinobacillus pleuropneumoniae]|uniref:Exoribonuclease 2 n=1 Tax=Actinobacillus pleuropneumoniae TaxID=715 RepID=A0ABN5MK38_ACTPL|nr:exoribonuclease II [Actinobacillus pleuropneumoniae]ASU16727.1 Exoribonuclease 2 [Actinobacillus pleuropneumoniae]AWG95166.1 exoribonuclease II [Actinobacillus pleuropneumoniae serovar 1 str. 4074]AXA21237.1 exoribonuclease II [Actinobacillus pleuropneumoniae]EFM94424.1 Exoribonuclease II [Actinobacillus pleuropneumoniae serovar 9 str. CVJ13261]EFM98554.1 Exoribonuclease II [Actinobacillus pleuropneumoniae serovar 11 str. 56153]